MASISSASVIRFGYMRKASSIGVDAISVMERRDQIRSFACCAACAACFT